MHQGCTGQHFFASGRGGAGQGSKFTGRGIFGAGHAGAGRGKQYFFLSWHAAKSIYSKNLTWDSTPSQHSKQYVNAEVNVLF